MRPCPSGPRSADCHLHRGDRDPPEELESTGLGDQGTVAPPSVPSHPATSDNHSCPHGSPDHQSQPPRGTQPHPSGEKALGTQHQTPWVHPWGSAAHTAPANLQGRDSDGQCSKAMEQGRICSKLARLPCHPASPNLPPGSAGPLSPSHMPIFPPDQELEPWDWCCRWNDKPSFCALYHQRRPRIGCAGYRPLRPGEAAGAPQG